MDPTTLGAYAGVAAQEQDTLGLPTYAQFKRHATFRTELTDFGVDLKQLTRLLSECNYGGCNGGVGLGDLPILFNATAKRMSAITFEGVLKICRLLSPRLEKVCAMLTTPSHDGHDPLRFRPGTAPARAPGTQQQNSSTTASGGAAAGTQDQAWAQPRGSLSSIPGGVGSVLRKADSTLGFDDAMALETTRGALRDGGGGILGCMAAGGRPQSATSAAGFGRGAFSAARPASAGSWARAGGQGQGGQQDGLGSLQSTRDPPVLLREKLPPPPCAFPTIAAQIQGVQAMYKEGDLARVALFLRELQREWEAAAQAAALAAAIRRTPQGSSPGKGRGSGAGGGGAGGPALPPGVAPGSVNIGEAAEAAARGEIPLEGRLWLLVLHACCLMREGNHRAAHQNLQAAESLCNPNVLGAEHPYRYCILMCQGLQAYYEHHHERAIDKFDAARELAGLVSRGSLDVTARRNAAACLNNKGVCQSLIGRRADAVASFRAAYQLVRATEGVPEVPEAVVALRNLNKALKQGFALNTDKLRPTSAPPMYSHVGSTAVPKDEKLAVFLRSAITMRAPGPVNSVPPFATKVTPEDIVAKQKAKEAAAKQKAKQGDAGKGKGDKGKKSTVKKVAPFEAMVTYPAPSYGIANVKLAAPKKGKKKKAA